MKTTQLSLSIFLFLGFASSTTAALQFPPNNVLALMELPEVRHDLGLTSLQEGKILSIKENLKEEFETRFSAATGITSFSTVVVDYYRSSDRGVLAILSSKQKARMRAIQYQSLGFRALILPDLCSFLDLKPRQEKAINELVHQTTNRRSNLFRTSVIVFPPVDHTQELAEIEDEFEAKSRAFLDGKQVERYIHLLGARVRSAEGTAPSVALIQIG